MNNNSELALLTSRLGSEKNVFNSTDVKTEVKEDTDDDNNKPVKTEIKTEVVAIKPSQTAIVPGKDAEPLTSAVAPIAQKLNPEKSHSPVEGKENIPIIKTGDTANCSKSPEIIEVPYKPKSPEIIDLEADTYTSTATNHLHQPFLHEVKKRKLDILKEGGLEVTPVRTFAPPMMAKDIRPSVIQPTGAQIIPKPIKSDFNNMPPPSVAPKRLQISIPQTLNVSHVKAEQPSVVNNNNKTPPKCFPYMNENRPIEIDLFVFGET